MDDISTLSVVIAAVSVVIGVILAVLQIRDLVKTRQTDLVIRLYSAYWSKEFQEALTRHVAVDYTSYDDFVKKYGPIPSMNEYQTSLRIVGTFYEGIGVLLSEKLVDINLIDKLFAVELYWRKVEPLIKDLRKQYHPRLWEWFEYLYNEIKKRQR